MQIIVLKLIQTDNFRRVPVFLLFVQCTKHDIIKSLCKKYPIISLSKKPPKTKTFIFQIDLILLNLAYNSI